MIVDECKVLNNCGEKYFICPQGFVYSIPRMWNRVNRKHSGIKMYGSPNSHGYYSVVLTHDKKRIPVKVHRLVALHFVENPHGYKEINHIDGNKGNNNVSNLEWCDRAQNLKHSYSLGLRISNKGKKYKKK